MSKEQEVHREVHSTSNTMHGGLNFVTKYIWSGYTDHKGQPEIYSIQEIRLHADCNSATIDLGDGAMLSPEFLRKLANALELAPTKAIREAERLAVAELTAAMNGR